MLEIYERKNNDGTVSIQHRVVLAHDLRVKGRFKTQTEGGVELRIFLDRGKTLAIGELLVSTDGQCIEVVGANELLSVASSTDPVVFAKACYHMGNRHMTLQVDEGEMRFKPDYVLEDMLKQQGLSVREELASFTPESGAYGHHHN